VVGQTFCKRAGCSPTPPTLRLCRVACEPFARIIIVLHRLCDWGMHVIFFLLLKSYNYQS